MYGLTELKLDVKSYLLSGLSRCKLYVTTLPHPMLLVPSTSQFQVTKKCFLFPKGNQLCKAALVWRRDARLSAVLPFRVPNLVVAMTWLYDIIGRF